MQAASRRQAWIQSSADVQPPLSKHETWPQINVDLPSNQASFKGYRESNMKLVNPHSGESLGRIACQVNEAGDVQSIKFISKR